MPSTDEIHERNVLMIAVGTVGAMRPSELVALDVCDWLGRVLKDAGGGPLGDAAYIKRQKKRPEWFGACSKDSLTDLHHTSVSLHE